MCTEDKSRGKRYRPLPQSHPTAMGSSVQVSAGLEPAPYVVRHLEGGRARGSSYRTDCRTDSGQIRICTRSVMVTWTFPDDSPMTSPTVSWSALCPGSQSCCQQPGELRTKFSKALAPGTPSPGPALTPGFLWLSFPTKWETAHLSNAHVRERRKGNPYHNKGLLSCRVYPNLENTSL